MRQSDTYTHTQRQRDSHHITHTRFIATHLHTFFIPTHYTKLSLVLALPNNTLILPHSLTLPPYHHHHYHCLLFAAFSLDTLKAMPGIGEKLSSGPMAMILNSMGKNNNNGNSSSNNSTTTANKNEQTVRDYDLQELRKLSQAVFFETISASYLHFVTKACKPLLFMPLMGIMNKLQVTITRLG